MEIRKIYGNFFVINMIAGAMRILTVVLHKNCF